MTLIDRKTWNTAAFLVFVAALMLVLGFAYGATFDRGCESAGATLGCVEFILNRYQTLIGIIGAVGAALVAARPVWQQIEIMQQQAFLQTDERLRTQEMDVERDRALAWRIAAKAKHSVAVEDVIDKLEKIYAKTAQDLIVPDLDKESDALEALAFRFEDEGNEQWGPSEVVAARIEILFLIHKLRRALMARKLVAINYAFADPTKEQPIGQDLRSATAKPDADRLYDACLVFAGHALGEVRRLRAARAKLGL